MNPIGNVYPIGAYAAEFRRKPMTERVKQAISRGLKKRRQMREFKKSRNRRYAGAALLGLYGLHEIRQLQKYG